jgi:hypothetical protein
MCEAVRKPLCVRHTRHSHDTDGRAAVACFAAALLVAALDLARAHDEQRQAGAGRGAPGSRPGQPLPAAG